MKDLNAFELGKFILIFFCISASNSLCEQAQSLIAGHDLDARVDGILSQLTLSQKLDYIGGTGFFDLKYRVPLNGRNFEYVAGEDPYLGSQFAPAEIMGIQSKGVWASAKHLVCNEEEENRGDVQIVVEERTLREIYLPPFEAAVKSAKSFD